MEGLMPSPPDAHLSVQKSCILASIGWLGAPHISPSAATFSREECAESCSADPPCVVQGSLGPKRCWCPLAASRRPSNLLKRPLTGSSAVADLAPSNQNPEEAARGSGATSVLTPRQARRWCRFLRPDHPPEHHCCCSLVAQTGCLLGFAACMWTSVLSCSLFPSFFQGRCSKRLKRPA